MKSQGVTMRECVDSADHPNTVPIILGLDMTGSMGYIPHELIKNGLPTLMGKIIENGCPDASLLFLGVGDSRSDRCPLQIGQFEASDELLDMWLTRVYIEGNGGGNGGEDYALAWEFAGKRTKIDSFDKRGEKGILITVGNENCHATITKRQLEEVYGANNSMIEGNSVTKEELLAEAKKKWKVFHINIGGYSSNSAWAENLGDNFIQINDHMEIPNVVSKIVLENMETKAPVYNSGVGANIPNTVAPVQEML